VLPSKAVNNDPSVLRRSTIPLLMLLLF
jgi:hypothetical protein